MAEGGSDFLRQHYLDQVHWVGDAPATPSQPWSDATAANRMAPRLERTVGRNMSSVKATAPMKTPRLAHDGCFAIGTETKAGLGGMTND